MFLDISECTVEHFINYWFYFIIIIIIIIIIYSSILSHK